MNFFSIFFSRSEYYHFIKLIQRIGIMMLVYTLLRIIFIAIYFKTLGDASFANYVLVFIGGFRFDLSAIVYINFVFIFFSLLPLSIRFHKIYQTSLQVLFYFTNFVFLLFAIGDLAYFKFTMKRTGVNFMGLAGDFKEQLGSYLSSYWYLVLLLLVLVFFIHWLYRKTRYKNKYKQHFFVQLFIMLFTSGLALLGARGGFQTRPISPIYAARYANGGLCPAVTNTPFILIQTFLQNKLSPLNYFDKSKCEKLFSIHHHFNNENNANKKNVVVIILESFSAEYFETFNANAKDLTPFLDSLMHESIFSVSGFANGKASNEGVPAVIASIPTMMNQSFINSPYQSNSIQGFGNLLKPFGYRTAFFHGANNGSFNFDNFSYACGFTNYFGRNEFKNDNEFDGNWGIWDEPFFLFMKNKLDEMPQPFCAAIFSVTSHFPFNIPEKYRKQFSKSTDEDPIYKTIRYTDYSLRKFFEEAAKEKWFTNTVFTFCADHTSENSSAYANRLSTFRIPIFIYDPSSTVKKEIQRPVSQVDLLPSIADYLGLNADVISFGQSMFDTLAKPYACQFIGGIYQLVSNNYFLEFDGEHTIGIYDFRTDPSLKNNLINEKIVDRKSMEDYLKAFIQTYNETLINNEMKPGK